MELFSLDLWVFVSNSCSVEMVSKGYMLGTQHIHYIDSMAKTPSPVTRRNEEMVVVRGLFGNVTVNTPFSTLALTSSGYELGEH